MMAGPGQNSISNFIGKQPTKSSVSPIKLRRSSASASDTFPSGLGCSRAGESVQRAAFAGAHGDDAGQERERAGADMKHESEQRQAATSTDSGMYMSRAIQASGRWTKRKISVSIMSL